MFYSTTMQKASEIGQLRKVHYCSRGVEASAAALAFSYSCIVICFISTRGCITSKIEF